MSLPDALIERIGEVLYDDDPKYAVKWYTVCKDHMRVGEIVVNHSRILGCVSYIKRYDPVPFFYGRDVDILRNYNIEGQLPAEKHLKLIQYKMNRDHLGYMMHTISKICRGPRFCNICKVAEPFENNGMIIVDVENQLPRLLNINHI